MSDRLVCMCKFHENTFVLSLQLSDGFEHFRSSVLRRWNELDSGSFDLYYTLPNHPRCHLDNEEDFQNMFYVVHLMGISCLNIDVVLMAPELRVAADTHSEAAECSRAGTNENGSDIFSTFCVHEKKQLMSVGWDTLLTGVGQVFEGGVKEVRMTLCKMRLHSGHSFKYEKNEPTRVHVVCLNKKATGCPWQVYVSKCATNGYFYVRQYVSTHTCTSLMNRTKGPSSKLVASLIEDSLRDKMALSPIEVKKHMNTSFGLSCSYDVAWNAVAKAKESVFGNDEISYSNIREYARCLLATNAGSHVVLDVDEVSSRFRRIFVAFGACIQGFNFCLPMLFLDGTHLKHRFKGHLLSATALDGNTGLYGLCFAIVDSENDENWLWFLENLRSCVDCSRMLTFVSDRNPGLVSGVPTVFPHCHHAYCWWHLQKNLLDRLGRAKFSKQFKERIVYLFKQCAYAPTVDMYNRQMAMLIAEGKGVVGDFIRDLPPDKWANAYFKGMRFGYICSSVAESFNSWIVKERELNVKTMIDRIRLKMMQQISDRRISSAKWSSDLCPQVDRTLTDYYKSCMSWNAVQSSSHVFEVICQPSVMVDVLNHTCTCHRWQVYGIPCEHAFLCIKKYGLDLLPCVNSVFHADSYRRCYSFAICPVPSLDMRNIEEIDPVLPPKSRKMPGRPKKRRIKSKGEICARKITCGRCGKKGNHNRKTCSEPLN